eukprot:SAG11_NODE_2326_length_3518_cov_401.419713_3_plen_159_part_00
MNTKILVPTVQPPNSCPCGHRHGMLGRDAVGDHPEGSCPSLVGARTQVHNDLARGLMEYLCKPRGVVHDYQYPIITSICRGRMHFVKRNVCERHRRRRRYLRHPVTSVCGVLSATARRTLLHIGGNCHSTPPYICHIQGILLLSYILLIPYKQFIKNK